MADGVHVPVVETERLLLRGHRLDDFPACAALWADPAVTRFIAARPSTEEEAWARFLRYAGHWAVMGFGYWAVEERATGRTVGDLGFAAYRRATEPPLGDDPELGWVLSAAAAGRGYATEAASAALAWGDRAFGGRRTVCIVAPEHARSLRVAEKVGYRPSGTVAYGEHTRLVLARIAPAELRPGV